MLHPGISSSTALRLLLPLALAAIAPQWAAATTPDNYVETANRYFSSRLNEFKSANDELKRVVLVGDSLTESFNVGYYFPQRNVLNRGIGSDTIGYPRLKNDKRGVLGRLDASVFETGANHVFLMIGINDIVEGHSPDDMATGYRKILSTVRARSPHATIYVQSLLPLGGSYVARNSAVVEFNKKLQELARDYGCKYVDLHKHFADTSGQMRSVLTVDGIHLSASGYKLWTEQIRLLLGW